MPRVHPGVTLREPEEEEEESIQMIQRAISQYQSWLWGEAQAKGNQGLMEDCVPPNLQTSNPSLPPLWLSPPPNFFCGHVSSYLLAHVSSSPRLWPSSPLPGLQLAPKELMFPRPASFVQTCALIPCSPKQHFASFSHFPGSRDTPPESTYKHSAHSILCAVHRFLFWEEHGLAPVEKTDPHLET